MAITEIMVTTGAAVDAEAEVGADLPGVVADAADRLNDRVGAGAIGIGTMTTILAGGATVAADPESVVVAGNVIAVDQGAVAETPRGPEIVTGPAKGRGVNETETAEAGDHTVGAGAENVTEIGIGIATETGGNDQRRVAADQKRAAAVAVGRMHEIEQIA